MISKLLPLGLLAAVSADPAWQAWKDQHRMQFRSVHEDTYRYRNFLDSKKFVENHNRRFKLGQESYHVALNKFAHMTGLEFNKMYLSQQRRAISDDPTVGAEYMCDGNQFTSDGSVAPDNLSYVAGQTDDVRVTMVKDQGSCGSCWTFGSSAAIEALMCKQGKKDCSTWTGLATQQMVDCASWTGIQDDSQTGVVSLSPYDNHACNGGLEPNAMRYVQMIGGQNNWDDYSYVSGSTGRKQNCAYNPATANTNIVTGCGNIDAGNEANMKDAMSQIGPMSVAIDASGDGFRFYSGGIYVSNTCSSSRLNHAVTGTGYGVDQDAVEAGSAYTEYWQIKNSWGEDWGQGGYINIARNAGNMCGVASDPHWVY